MSAGHYRRLCFWTCPYEDCHAQIVSPSPYWCGMAARVHLEFCRGSKPIEWLRAWAEELEAEQARRAERAQKKIPKRAGAA